MINMFDDLTIKIDEYKPDSKGVEVAKRYVIFSRVIKLLALACIIIVYGIFIKEEIFNRYLVSGAYIYLGLAIAVTFLVIHGLVVDFITSAKSSFTDEEKFDFNYYLLYKVNRKNEWLRNNRLTALAVNSALLGRKDKCKDALYLISDDYKPQVVSTLQEWIDSDAETIDRKAVSPAISKPRLARQLILETIIVIGLLTGCFDYHTFVNLGISEKIIWFFGLAQCIDVEMFTVTAILAIIFQFNKNKLWGKYYDNKNRKMLLVILLCTLPIIFLSVITNDALGYGMGINESEDDSEITTDYEDDSDDYYDYSDSYDYEDSDDYDYDYADDYSYDDEEAYDNYPQEIDIMNEMIVLCNYLQKNGVIDDFHVELGYNAKGYVKGTVAQDDDYVYVLYDNGVKEDSDGNDCIELVLEAEPLDDNGNSLGQQEAKLKGFYLVNLETDEVIDEHKTHW